MRVWLFVLGLAGLTAVAQTTFQEQAERLQNINAYLIDFRAASAPVVMEEFTIEAVLDVTPQPSIDNRVGVKSENIDAPNVVPKLRGRFYWANGLMVGVAYAPGIDFQGYKAEFIAAELGWRMDFSGWTAGLRGSYIDGDVEGPVTEADLDDLFTFTNMGLDLSLARRWNAFVGYGFVGLNDIETELDVTLDGAHLVSEDDALYGGLGVQWATQKWSVNLEQNFTDSYLRHLTLSLGYRF